MNDIISILIPVFNGEKFLQETLNSLYAQTFQNFEIVIVDDGSRDNTAAIVQAQKDQRIRYYLNEQNQGIVYTLNRGLKLCNGKYIVRIDADDIALPHRLEKQWHFMEANPDVALCGTSLNRFSETYSIVERRGGDDAITRARLLFDTAINHPSAIIRKNILQEHALEYPSDYLHTEDYALWYMMSQYGKVVNLDDVLVRYRMHGNNLSMQYNRLQYQNMNRMRIRIMDDFLQTSQAGNKADMLRQYEDLLSLNRVSIDEMVKMDRLLMNVIKINMKSKIYDDTALKRAAAWFWFVVFTHENCPQYSWKMLRLFLWNKESVCRYLDKQFRKKLWLKSLLRWRKKEPVSV